MLGTIDNMSQLLKLFTLDRPEWGITELADALGWSTSKTHDLAASLVEIGMLRKGENRRYEMGWRVLELSQVILGSSTLQSEARKAMENLSAKYDEHILLGVLAGGKVLFVDKSARHSIPESVSQSDMRLNAHCTSAGKVLLAHLTETRRQAIIDEHGLEPMTANSIQSFEELIAELEEVKKQGYAFGIEELTIGMGSVAAPVFDYSANVVAALSLSSETKRFERRFDLYKSLVIETANQISTRLGYLKLTS